ncbi:MAG TPA: RNA polymerase sigma factor [Herbaspirillum sp.]|jgi:RNA polymerase sigma-70 factor (ECF subfamily)
MISENLDDWFLMEVLPLEDALVRFLRRNSRSDDDVADLRQEVYVRVYEAAKIRKPDLVKPFVFSAARNLLIDRARRSQIVSIEAYADLDTLNLPIDDLTPERYAIGNEELRLLQNAMNELPIRCREVVKLRKIDGLSQREVAAHMGITEDTVEKQISKGVRALTEALLQKGVALRMPRIRIATKFHKKGSLE